MKMLKEKTVVVAGGTGNVGSFIVRGLLHAGARVVVPSRSESKLNGFKEYLDQFEHLDKERLHTFIGNIGDEKESKRLLETITESVGTPDAAISMLGRFIQAPSLLEAPTGDLNIVLDNYLMANYVVARTFLPVFLSGGGTFVFINGPLAIKPWEGSGLVSTATAAQQMLFRSLAAELEDTPARVAELMTYAYIRNRQTQPGSTVTGEAVGALASWMVSGPAEAIHGETIHLKSMDKLKELGIEVN
jgi:NAD(P)-dependent dehydrogenase (short-subunit alcohol dehydrogenase family)